MLLVGGRILFSNSDDNQMEITLISNDVQINYSKVNDNWMEITSISNDNQLANSVNIK